MKRIGFTSGSFDPVTNGHIDVIARAARIVETLVIGIGVHPGKSPLFSTAERVEMLKAETAGIAKKTGCRIEIVTFDTLTVDAARAAGATLIFRGLCSGTDFDYEMEMSGMNAAMAPGIDTVFLPTRTNYGFVSASLVREIASHGGDVSRYAPGVVCEALVKKFARR